MTCGVYHVTNTTTGRRYIGSAKITKNRLSAHRRLLERGRHPTQAMQLDFDQGHEFEYGLLELCPEDNRLEREQHHVDIAGGPLYNIALTVAAGSCDPEVQRRISEGVKRQWSDPEAPIRKAVERLWTDPSFRDSHTKNMALLYQNLEFKAEFGAKVAASWTPERRALQAERCREMVKVRKTTGRKNWTPEQRARSAELCRQMRKKLGRSS